MKIITMYLPQYHIVKENSEWWGEGYTDWVAVKQAESLYEGHNQPRVPKNNNYYNLMQKEAMQWQANLMQQYGIDGICMYHYWFKNGKKILEKPAENLLKWSEINMPFCFYWDSQSWVRSWSKMVNSHSWSHKFESKESTGGKTILLEQDYGTERQWKQHFDYLLPFFKDDRYICINEKPVFMFYRTSSIPCFRQMIAKWNEWAIEQGFAGLYIIGANGSTYLQSALDANIYHEPLYAFSGIGGKRKEGEPRRVSYDTIWNRILNNRRTLYKTYYSGFVGYDDTPRRDCFGSVVEGQTPEKFQQYLTELLAKNEASGNEITFLNAWNEWGESMYLEPDEKEDNKYLQAVLRAKVEYKEYIPKYVMQNEKYSEEMLQEFENLQEKSNKYQFLWRILDKWMLLKERNIQVSEYFVKKGIQTVGIYGLGNIGKHLLEELKHTQVEVIYAIDQNKGSFSVGIPVYSIENELPEVDMIVMTMVESNYLEWILKSKLNCNIITINQLLDECIRVYEKN